MPTLIIFGLIKLTFSVRDFVPIHFIILTISVFFQLHSLFHSTYTHQLPWFISKAKFGVRKVGRSFGVATEQNVAVRQGLTIQTMRNVAVEQTR